MSEVTSKERAIPAKPQELHFKRDVKAFVQGEILFIGNHWFSMPEAQELRTWLNKSLPTLLAVLLLTGCDVPPECASFKDATFVRYKPTGEIVFLDYIDFEPRIKARGIDRWARCSCNDLENP